MVGSTFFATVQTKKQIESRELKGIGEMGAVKKAILYYHNYGLKATLRKILLVLKNRGIRNTARQLIQDPKIDLFNFYKYIIDDSKINFVKEDYIRLKDGPIYLNWIIPEMGMGSGGHINIFRFVTKLQKRGIKNRIYTTYPINIQTDGELRAFLRANYCLDPDEIELYCGTEKIAFAHGTVATSWQTAYFVRKFNNTLSKFYFVQDYEPFFYAVGSEYIFAENTYKFGFYGITAGDWLKEKLHNEYGMKTASVGFSYDRDIYRPIQKRDNVKRIFFYARPVTARRAFELGLLALIELYHRMPDIEVIFAGWDIGNYDIPFIHLNGGMIKLEELSDLYGQCDMCLVLSSTNLSLLPLEVMASNSVVVSNRGENNEWLLNLDNAILTDFDPLDIARKMEYYLVNSDELAKIRARGKAFAESTDWEVEAKKAYDIIVREIEFSTEQFWKESDA